MEISRNRIWARYMLVFFAIQIVSGMLFHTMLDHNRQSVQRRMADGKLICKTLRLSKREFESGWRKDEKEWVWQSHYFDVVSVTITNGTYVLKVYEDDWETSQQQLHKQHKGKLSPKQNNNGYALQKYLPPDSFQISFYVFAGKPNYSSMLTTTYNDPYLARATQPPDVSIWGYT